MIISSANLGRQLSLLTLLCLCFCAGFKHHSAFASQKVLVIFASKNCDEVTFTDIRNYYSLDQKLLPNQERVLLSSLHMKHDATVKFSQIVFGYYPYQLQRLWDQAAFSGRAKRPKQYDNIDDLMGFIKHNDNALAYAMVAKNEINKMKEDYHVIKIIE